MKKTNFLRFIMLTSARRMRRYMMIRFMNRNKRVEDN